MLPLGDALCELLSVGGVLPTRGPSAPRAGPLPQLVASAVGGGRGGPSGGAPQTPPNPRAARD
eukprot:1024232-Pyramimonas_sp.AAC.1